MSTRGFYRFVDFDEAETTYNVYKHSDNYPSGGLLSILAALPYVWALPRYEADEFSAGFVAGNKNHYISRLLDDALEKAKPIAEAAPMSYELIRVDQVPVNPMMFRGQSGGGVRLHQVGSNYMDFMPGDVEYLYTIYPDAETSTGKGSWLPNVNLKVRCESVYRDRARVCFDVLLSEIIAVVAECGAEHAADRLIALHYGATENSDGSWTYNEDIRIETLEELLDVINAGD